MEEILRVSKDILLEYWWIAAPVVLFFILRSIWLSYVRSEYLKGLKWMVLEIKIPRDVIKTPKAMEQFFAGLHATKKELKFKEKYFKGMIPPWHAIEIIGQGGAIHFFIRAESKYRDLIESQIYAQYPQAEIQETDDYVSSLPHNIPNKEYDILGSEAILNKEDVYPIRTYPVFFEEKEAEERTDPVASLFEFLNALNPQERVWIQILVSPTGDEWKQAGEKIVGKMTGKKIGDRKKGGSYAVQETGNWIRDFIQGFLDLFLGLFTGSEEKKEEKEKVIVLSPGEKEIAAAIEKNIAKLGFKTMIRFVYWAPKDIFSKDKITAIGGFFKQFNTQNLNGFKPNKRTAPGRGVVFKKRREKGQKRYFAGLYKRRYFPQNISGRGFIFNTEELATIFHIPGKFVEVEKMGKIEAKKGGPPTSLPTG